MTNEQMPKEMMKFWKQSWEAYLNTLGAMREQGEKMMDMMLENNGMMPDEGKKAIKDWAENAKKMQQSYIDMMTENIKKMDDMVEKKK